MSFALTLSMISLSLVMSISPGPVNMFIISSSINNGFKKTFAFVSGATFGFTLLLLFIALGFITVLLNYPLFLKILSVLGTTFIIFLGYKIATAPTSLELQKDDKRSLRFYQGFLLQWLNPKAWMAGISGISIYSNSQEVLFSFIFIYFIICYLSLSFWAIVGKNLQIFLNTHKRLKIFNITMGVILTITALYLLAV